jgi:hypothetical protein
MKTSLLFYSLFTIILFSCKKDKQPYDNNLNANWKATEWSNDIGCGCTPFSPVPADSGYFMHFKPNNDFEGKYIFSIPNYNKYRIIDSTRLVFYKQNTTDSLRVWYSFLDNNETLQIAFPCIEGCRLKLVRQ